MMVRAAQDIEKNGYVFLPRHLPAVSSTPAFRTLGDVVKLPTVSEVQVLRPHTRGQSSPNTYSGNFGLQEFPLHTDLAHWFLPPRYLSLRCVRGTTEVATHLLDSTELVNEFGESALASAFVRPRRPVGRSNYLLRLYGPTDEGENLFRWDSLFITPATETSTSTYKSVSNRLASMLRTSVYLEHEGDTLIIDNWRMLHGRAAIADSGMSRYIERAYLGALK